MSDNPYLDDVADWKMAHQENANPPQVPQGPDLWAQQLAAAHGGNDAAAPVGDLPAPPSHPSQAAQWVNRHKSTMIQDLKRKMAANQAAQMAKDPRVQRLEKAMIFKNKNVFATPDVHYDEQGNPHGQRSAQALMPDGKMAPMWKGQELFALEDSGLDPGDLDYFKELMARGGNR